MGKRSATSTRTSIFCLPTKTRSASFKRFVFHASVGGKIADRYRKETRTYESKPDGRLLAFSVEARGDGGDQLLDATSTPAGLTVVIKRPGMPNRVLNLPPSKEHVEDADQSRVAILRGKRIEGLLLDSDDLQSYKVTTTLGPAEKRIIGGVTVAVRKATTISDKEKLPTDEYLADDGRVLEVNLGQSMVGRAEPESVAKRMDQVEIFGLTRVVLPKPLPESARAVPGTVTLIMSGLPDRFLKNTYRQKFTKLKSGQVQVTLSAMAPKLRHAHLPLQDPQGGLYLKSSLQIESDDPQIRATAQRIAGSDHEAYVVSRKIVDWVSQNMSKDYGSSYDRSTDVLRYMKGDCTEHSLLAVALLRAAGIPARRVDGVVYVRQDDGVPALYWHEWVEAYVGEWTQLDPTFGQAVADATHLAVGEEQNAEIVPLIGQMKVLDDR